MSSRRVSRKKLFGIAAVVSCAGGLYLAGIGTGCSSKEGYDDVQEVSFLLAE